jgi:hypothetical protein
MLMGIKWTEADGTNDMWRSIGELAGTTMQRVKEVAGPLREERETSPQMPGGKTRQDMTIGQGTVRPHANCPSQIVP